MAITKPNERFPRIRTSRKNECVDHTCPSGRPESETRVVFAGSTARVGVLRSAGWLAKLSACAGCLKWHVELFAARHQKVLFSLKMLVAGAYVSSHEVRRLLFVKFEILQASHLQNPNDLGQ